MNSTCSSEIEVISNDARSTSSPALGIGIENSLKASLAFQCSATALFMT
ncbi:hypothetical protein SynPROS91_01207 [Synechococcus sp. PROS-9-1]|nr:hypothetical protein SynPROS91_01207 [Synechococcus sp. PROS-9-1]